MKSRNLFLTVVTLAACITPASAAPTWNLTGSGQQGSSFSFTSEGITLTTTGFGNTGAGGTLVAGTLGRYSSGMGVCNASEGANCSSPSHQVDNYNGVDLVLFTFSAPVSNIKISLASTSGNDADFSYWLRTTPGAVSLAGLTLATLPGFGAQVNKDTAATFQSNVDLGGTNVYALVVSARTGSGADYNKDYFKISSLGATNPIPEPATYVLLGSSLLGLGLARRWRRS